jgi:hypothetical protein
MIAKEHAHTTSPDAHFIGSIEIGRVDAAVKGPRQDFLVCGDPSRPDISKETDDFV